MGPFVTGFFYLGGSVPNIQVKVLTSLSYLDHIATPQMSVCLVARDLGCVSPLSILLERADTCLHAFLELTSIPLYGSHLLFAS